jgi:mono/diheme cytochrome c family protein
MVPFKRLVAIGCAGFAIVATMSSASAAPPFAVERGEYLARAGDCISCHTAEGGKSFTGGLYMETPFGQISTPNLTPDKLTGIGEWSDEEFSRAMHEGIGKHGEYLYPVFPFPWYTKVTRDDVLTIRAYLFSLPPENAPRKPYGLAFPSTSGRLLPAGACCSSSRARPRRPPASPRSPAPRSSAALISSKGWGIAASATTSAT